MLQLTKRTEYGLIALVHMVEHPGTVVSVREIGERYPVPRRLLAEVLKDLARLGLVDSHRGPTGGYCLARAAERITLADVVQALEGAPELTNCESTLALKLGGCEVKPVCRIRSPIQRVRATLWRALEETTLRELAHPASPPSEHSGDPAARAARALTRQP
jgi:Rrf2 family protein